MEKLVLRGIMYGADKIPDSWFDKVPGGFFKEKEQERRDHRSEEKRRSKRDKSRRRRHSDEYGDRRARHNDEEEYYEYDRYARPSETRRRHARSRSSYDGSNDFGPSYDDRDRRYAARRRTYHEDGDRHGYDEDLSRHGSSRKSHASNGRPRDSLPVDDPRSPASSNNSNIINSRNSAATAAASAGTAAALSQQAQRSPPPPAAPVVTPIVTGYVPYSNIYGPGAAQSPAAYQAYPPPPPASITNSIQTNGLNQVSPPPAPPPASHFTNSPSASPYDPRNFTGPFQAPSPRHQAPYTPSRSPSPPRRTRSERRPTRDADRPPRGKSLSRVRESVSLSQQGLGYSTVENGIGKGRAPAVAGTTIGRTSANTLVASQKFVDPRKPMPPPPHASTPSSSSG